VARPKGDASDEGAFSFVPGVPPEKVRSSLRGFEFKVTKALVRTRREPAAWTGALLVGIHRDVFKVHFPDGAGRLRRSEANFGARAAEAPERLSGLILQLAVTMSAHLAEVLAMAEDEARLEVALLHAARDHAEMIRIHPFVDGNGRWARIASTAFLADCGYPVGSIIRSARKGGYIAAIDRCIDQGESGDLADLFLTGFVEAMEDRNRR
jgi:fido (protein-threonine AMPylation protein)